MKKLLGLILLLIGAKIMSIYVYEFHLLWQITVKFIGVFLFIQGGLILFNKTK
ncbi:hypothetical protein MKY07_15680 [Solibacillus sp. FSL W7-1472]|uniref:Uncharacterized protein n=2 Tax=Solibacillus TaxID=648800 RepID=F2F1F5_SOLSS|nr:hypothetical protein [Solibacillus silvestris]EKB45592.1 hypothetical protein B857_01543 [Solibacillus isronensis B3W22]BAK15293.1 hypothetical protein SSIL_0870 [Solibacillus silvestris StLB046]